MSDIYSSPAAGRGTITVRPVRGAPTGVPMQQPSDVGGSVTGTGGAAVPTDTGWGDLQADYQPSKIGQPLQPQQPGFGAQLMQAMPSIIPQQQVNDDWSDLSGSYQPHNVPAQPMSQGEAALHGAAHGATASFSPVLAGSAALGARYEMLDYLMQAKAMGSLNAQGEAALQQLQAELQDPMQVYRAERDREQGNVAAASEQYPWTTGAAEGIGAIATPLPFGKGRAAVKAGEEVANIGGKLIEPMAQMGEQVGQRVAPWVQNMMHAIKSGATYGGLSGAGSSVSQGEGIPQTLFNTMVGSGIGAAGGAVLSPAFSMAGTGLKFAKDRAWTIGRGVLSDLGFITPERMAETAIRNAEAQGAPIVEKTWQQPGMIRAMQRAGNLAEDEGALVRGSQGDMPTASLARTAADTSEVARQAITEHVQRTFAGQANRVAQGIRVLLMGRGKNKIGPQEIEQKIAQHEEEVRRGLSSGYNTMYRAYGHGMDSEELQILARSGPIQQAMRDAYARWHDRMIADRTAGGAMPPGLAVRNGQGVIPKRGSNQDVPITPNIQFWDYVKREMDQQVRQAERGTNPRGDDVGLLKTLRGQLRTELNNLTNGLYDNVVGGAAVKFKTLGVDADNMFEAGAKFVLSSGNGTREADAEFAKILASATSAEKELFKYGFLTEILSRLDNMPDREDVLNKIFLGAPGKGSESARRRIKMVLGEGEYGANQLEALLRVEAAIDRLRQAQGNSWSGRLVKKYLNESLLATGGALFGAEGWRNEDPEAGFLKKWGAMVAMLIGVVAAHRGRQFDERVAQHIAEKLLSGSVEGERDVVNMFANSPKLMAALRASQTQFAEWMARQNAGAGAARAGMAYEQPFNKGTPLQITVRPDHSQQQQRRPNLQ